MFGLQQDDIDAIIKLLSNYPQIEQAIIFGSRAKGNYKAGSDIDIALKGNNIDEVVWKVHYKLEEESILPYYFDLLDYNKIENKELIEHINRAGIVFYDRSNSLSTTQ